MRTLKNQTVEVFSEVNMSQPPESLREFISEVGWVHSWSISECREYIVMLKELVHHRNTNHRLVELALDRSTSDDKAPFIYAGNKRTAEYLTADKQLTICAENMIHAIEKIIMVLAHHRLKMIGLVYETNCKSAVLNSLGYVPAVGVLVRAVSHYISCEGMRVQSQLLSVLHSVAIPENLPFLPGEKYA